MKYLDCAAQFMHLMTTFHSTNKRHLKLIQQLQQYIKYKELPYSLQQRLLNYYNYRNRKGFERDRIIINHVSPYLREVCDNVKRNLAYISENYKTIDFINSRRF